MFGGAFFGETFPGDSGSTSGVTPPVVPPQSTARKGFRLSASTLRGGDTLQGPIVVNARIYNTVAIADQVAPVTFIHLTNSISISDTTSSRRGFVRANSADISATPLSVGDLESEDGTYLLNEDGTKIVLNATSVSPQISLKPIISNTISVSGSVAPLVHSKKTLANTVSISDSTSTLRTVHAVVADTDAIADSVVAVRHGQIVTTVTNTLSISDTTFKLGTYLLDENNQPILDEFGNPIFVIPASPIVTLHKQLSNTISVSESTTTRRPHVVGPVADSVPVSAAVTFKRIAIKPIIADSALISDSTVAVPHTPVSAAVLYDTDDIAGSTSHGEVDLLDENGNVLLDENGNPIVLFYASDPDIVVHPAISNSIPISDTTGVAAVHISVGVADADPISASVLPAPAIKKILVNSDPISDSTAVSAVVIHKLISDFDSISDVVSAARKAFALEFDSISDSTFSQISVHPRVSDTATIQDSVRPLPTYRPLIADSAPISNFVTLGIHVSPRVSDTLSISDSVRTAPVIASVLLDFDSISDSTKSAVVERRPLSESITISAIAILTPHVRKALTETDPISEVVISVLRTAGIFGPQELLQISSLVRPREVVGKQLFALVQISDVARTHGVFVAHLFENLEFGEEKVEAELHTVIPIHGKMGWMLPSQRVRRAVELRGAMTPVRRRRGL